MKATITKITVQDSRINKDRHTGRPSKVYMVCFKCDDGKSRNSWIDSAYGNFSHWNGILSVGNSLDNLNLNSRGNVDADSFPRLVKTEPAVEIEAEVLPKEEGAKQEKLFS